MIAARRLQVFAVEPEAIQLSWAALGPGEITARALDEFGEVAAAVAIEADGGPGVADLVGLRPDAAYTVEVAGHCLAARTVAPPPGRELYRFMTLSDMHLGLDHFGLFRKMREREPVEEIHTLRCTRAALDEGLAWGAQHLVLKGDLVDRGTPDEYDLLGKVLAEAGLPVEAIPGNHEVKPYREVDHPEAFAGLGLTVAPERLHTIDLPGLRVALVDSTTFDVNAPRLDHAVDAMADALDGRPALVVLHHHLLRLPFSVLWPPGVPGPLARRFLDAVADASPAALVASGHTHRHVTRKHRHVVVTETGSPKDHPGTWTGYVVYEGGLRQVVRRVGRPDAIGWTEHSRRAAGGAWGHWSPGRLDHRCLTLQWPRSRA